MRVTFIVTANLANRSVQDRPRTFSFSPSSLAASSSSPFSSAIPRRKRITIITPIKSLIKPGNAFREFHLSIRLEADSTVQPVPNRTEPNRTERRLRYPSSVDKPSSKKNFTRLDLAPLFLRRLPLPPSSNGRGVTVVSKAGKKKSARWPRRTP